jgi:hypothetical protein
MRMTNQTAYQIHIAGSLDLRLVEWFEGLAQECGRGRQCVLLTPPIDQAALRGLLSALFNLNVRVIAVLPRSWETGEKADA